MKVGSLGVTGSGLGTKLLTKRPDSKLHSAFTHATAFTLAESLNDLYIEGSDSFVASAAASIARVERTSSRAGAAPAEVQRLFTAHFFNNYVAY